MKGFSTCLYSLLWPLLLWRSLRFSLFYASSTCWLVDGRTFTSRAAAAKAYTRSSTAMLVLLLTITAVASSALASSLAWSSAQYDTLFKGAAAAEWSDLPDWTWLKAQAMQESGLDPLAVSPVGAAGLMQFMPGTWSDMQRQLGWRNVDPRSPQHAIIAGAHYMRSLREAWSSHRPIIEKQSLALASYNAGMGNILKAQRQCKAALLWSVISTCLAQVTGPVNAKQTIDYIPRIERYRGMQ